MRRRFMNASKEQESKYMIIEALEDNFTVTLNGRDAFVEYSIDGEIWNTLNVGQTTSTINSGEQLLFKGKHTQTGTVYLGFEIKKQCNLKGTCMALLGDEYAIKNKTLKNRNFAFSGLFVGCTGILSVDKNFLPATTLSKGCYGDMFRGCTSLVNAPELPASTLTSGCYSFMFSGCTKLNYIKMLATDISASDCLFKWVDGVASTGTFVKNPSMTSLPTGTSGIPSGWTVVNDGEESGGGNLITFYIADSAGLRPTLVEYQAIEGMTWGEWVDSKYNTRGIYIGVYDSVLTPDGFGITSHVGVSQKSNIVIISGEEYELG